MSGPFGAGRRLELLNAVLALAEDRGDITVGDAAEQLGTTEARVRACIEPLTDLELVEGSSFFGDLGNLVQLTGDRIVVRENWWRDLGGSFTPSEAARLYVMIVTASEVLGDHETVNLGRLKRRLRGQIGVLVYEPIPEEARVLLEAAAGHALVEATVESVASSLLPGSGRWEVHRVFHDGQAWKATLCPADFPSNSMVRDVYVEQIHRLRPTTEGFDAHREYEWAPSGTGPIEVMVRHTLDMAWRLEYFNPEELDRDGSWATTRLTVSGLPELRTLLLRLGPDGHLVEPADLTALQEEVARQVLDRYAL